MPRTETVTIRSRAHPAPAAHSLQPASVPVDSGHTPSASLELLLPRLPRQGKGGKGRKPSSRRGGRSARCPGLLGTTGVGAAQHGAGDGQRFPAAKPVWEGLGQGSRAVKDGAVCRYLHLTWATEVGTCSDTIHTPSRATKLQLPGRCGGPVSAGKGPPIGRSSPGV